ncbi:unnamed protein product (macronuclear) [Paramecium tetraurelia]|uniref:Uncharacterized protein n=1 Tax=Paramecium tetraurelia TaxID=5888 RepID=A0CAT3_PARTE|nr:uncharacterized protein GSPATT00036681001 [Paramecium tetraurelia]CAK67900.1 unnamed protein product [Paramecium tetraurelia]|eukprot:XP_001435297.1 hypothetical protein (macronuclear) [Paramecium tetraurelia strain d4-2]
MTQQRLQIHKASAVNSCNQLLQRTTFQLIQTILNNISEGYVEKRIITKEGLIIRLMKKDKIVIQLRNANNRIKGTEVDFIILLKGYYLNQQRRDRDIQLFYEGYIHKFFQSSRQIFQTTQIRAHSDSYHLKTKLRKYERNSRLLDKCKAISQDGLTHQFICDKNYRAGYLPNKKRRLGHFMLSLNKCIQICLKMTNLGPQQYQALYTHFSIQDQFYIIRLTQQWYKLAQKVFKN